MRVKSFCQMMIPLAVATALAGGVTSNAQAASEPTSRVTARAAPPIPPIKPVMTFAQRQLSRPAWRTASAQFRVAKRYYDLGSVVKRPYDRLMWRERAKQLYCAIVYDMFGNHARWRYWAQYSAALRQAYAYCFYRTDA